MEKSPIPYPRVMNQPEPVFNLWFTLFVIGDILFAFVILGWILLKEVK